MSILVQKYVDGLEGELKSLTEKEIELFRKSFENDVLGKDKFVEGAQMMVPKRDQWLIEMLAIISARSIFVGNWCSQLEAQLNEK